VSGTVFVQFRLSTGLGSDDYDRVLGISARGTSRHSSRKGAITMHSGGKREVPGAMWHGPYRTYMEALQKLKQIGHKKCAQLNCRYCNPQYGPRQWDADC
jgi:hypothetical protein